MSGDLQQRQRWERTLCAHVLYSLGSRCSTRSRKILQFKHYSTDAPV